jgi:DNA/RNA-binding domain of Phe-tRNA-synthetase-like protein
MSSPEILVRSEIQDILPGMKLGFLVSPVIVEADGDDLETEMAAVIEERSSKINAEAIRNIPPVKAAKEAYKALGKDPNRYRPSAEALLRRVSKGKGLYRINNLVDCLNLVSIQTGYSICGYDYNKIEGAISLGKGEPGEPYEGIGRGVLNIENLPVFRDQQGAFGTPTSDSERTLIDENTTKTLMIIPAFGGDSDSLLDALNMLSGYLKRFVANARPVIQLEEIL